MSPKKFANLYISTKFLGLESVLAIAACLVVHGHHVLDGHAVRVGQVGDLDAYLGERYIGYFDGKYYNDDAVDDYGGHHYLSGYRGNFHSVKGAKLEFYVYAD